MSRKPLSPEEYLVEIRKKLDGLKTVAQWPRYASATSEQYKILSHLIKRVIELGEGCFLVSAFETPSFVLYRVICEYFLLIMWVSLSEDNAIEYSKIPAAQLKKFMRINLEKKHGRLVDRVTGEDRTEQVLKERSAEKLAARRIEQIAEACGQVKLYDIVYRMTSLYVHGNTFGGFLPTDPSIWRVNAFSGIAALLNASLIVVEQGPNGTYDIAKYLGWIAGSKATGNPAGFGASSVQGAPCSGSVQHIKY